MKFYPFIAAEKPGERNVNRTCALLEVSRSAYYQWSKHKPSAHAARDTELRARIGNIHRESRQTYGALRVHGQLLLEGFLTGHNRVARLMAHDGLQGRVKRRFRKTTIADPEATALVTDLLKRDFAPATRTINEAWVGDITYIRTHQGWAYLATVIDLASRRVVGFAVAGNMRTNLIEEAMTMALKGRHPAPGLIFHSDRGSQYTSTAFRSLLDKHQIRQSLSRPRQCWDNAVAESFFSTLKTELIYRTAIPTIAAARSLIFEYIEAFYNRHRLHSTLGYKSPFAYEACMLNQPVAAPAA